MSDLPSRSSIFGSKAITEEALQLQVDRIIIGGDETPDGKNFHFGLSLINLTNGQCIHFDPRPSFLDLNDPNIGTVAVEWRDHNHSQTNVNTPAFTMDTLNMPTAAAICRLVLEEKKLDQYRYCVSEFKGRFLLVDPGCSFTGEGTGCRHWCAVVLEVLMWANVVKYGVVEEFERWEVDQAVKYGNKFPMPRIKGQFYS